MRHKGENNSRYIDRTGETHKNNQGCKGIITEYFGTKNCTMEFENGYVAKNLRYKNIELGKVSNLYHPSVHGVGYLGVGKYTRKSHKKAYNKWAGMLERTYAYQEKLNHQSYKDSTVCEEWKCFQNFAEWFEENYNSEYMQDWELDKDIKVKGNKIYSSDTCILVPKIINGLFAKCKGRRGECPIGVRKKGNKFQSVFTINKKQIEPKISYIKEEAFEHYKNLKEAHIKKIADEWRLLIGEEAYQAMYNYKVEITD